MARPPMAPEGMAHMRSYNTPLGTDVLFYDRVDRTIPKNQNWKYGDPHPNKLSWPDHKLVLVSPTRDDQFQIWYYAANWEKQDLYNWEFAKGSAGDFRFDAIRRTYLIERGEFNEQQPAMGADMAKVPSDTFSGEYVLFQRTQTRSTIPELDSLYITEVRTYVKRVSLGQVDLDLQTGKSKQSVTTLYYRGEQIEGFGEIGELAENPYGPYWGQAADGTFRELKQLSADWFSVTESNASSGNGEPNSPDNPAKVSQLIFPTPSILDFIVREVGRLSDPPLPYGTLHYDQIRYPGHVLSYQRPVGTSGLDYEFFYTAPRENQDAYNFEVNSSDVLTRTYIIPRADYFVSGSNPPAFAHPSVGTPDEAFPKYIFSHETIVRSEQELDGVFVMVQRFYQQPLKTRRFYDDDLDCDVTEVTRIIPAGTGASSTSAGETIEIQPVNTFYELEVTTTAGGSYPRQLKTLITDVRYPFPAWLRGVTLEYAYAYAASASAAPAYQEDWLFNYDLVEPTGGPYDARILRFLTGDPDQYQADYPVQKIVTVRETIGISKAWYSASDRGNSVFADVQQLEVPPSIHDFIEIGNADTISVGQNKTSLPATPGFRAFASGSEMVIGHEPKKTRYGLYEVSITILNTSGVYNGVSSSVGTGGSTGADQGAPVVGIPSILSASINASNTFITGTATPLASMMAFVGDIRYGAATSDASGNFSIPLSPIITDRVALSVRAVKNSKTSLTTLVYTNDLVPDAPSAYIPADLASVSGKSEPGALIRISANPVQQIETATVSVTAITLDGDGSVFVTSSLIPGNAIDILFPVVIGNTADDVAQSARDALAASSVINTRYDVLGSGPQIILKALVAAPNDPLLNIGTSDSTSDGIDDSPTSVDTVPGRSPVTTTADSTGTYTYSFSPILVNGDILTITASDAGGTSAATTVTASSTPPVLTSASFVPDVYNQVQGSAGIGSLVRAHYEDELIGSDTADGSGDYVITLDKSYINGEKIRITSFDPASENPSGSGIYTSRSQSIDLTAASLDLPAPVYVSSSIGYIGTAPAGAIEVVTRFESTGVETVFPILEPSREFVFNLENNGYKNGQRYEVFFHYNIGTTGSPIIVESKSVFIAFPVVALPGVEFFLACPLHRDAGPMIPTVAPMSNAIPYLPREWRDGIRDMVPVGQITVTSLSNFGSPSAPNTYITINSGRPLLVIRNPNLTPGTTILFEFPGQATASFSVTAEKSHFFGNLIYFPYTLASGATVYAPQPTPSFPTFAQLQALVPPLIRVTVQDPDGRTSVSYFDRSKTHLGNTPDGLRLPLPGERQLT